MRQLYILDPFEKLHIENDTSILLMNEAIRRGIEVHSCTEFDISRDNRGFSARARRHEKEISSSILEDRASCGSFELELFDCVFIRKDPPFDASYLTLLLLLQELRRPLVINSPLALLRYNEKLSIFLFPEYITETLVSSSLPRIREFVRDAGGSAVLKPLFGCSGRDVKLLQDSDPAFDDEVRSSTARGTGKVMLQRYLPAVTEGETRVFLLEDRVLAVMKKVPAPGSFKANFDFGARGLPHALTPREETICRAVGAFCKKEGIILSALDLIDGHLSEFNITSPGLLVESNRVDNARYEEEVIRFVTDRSGR
ncbi:MAG: hypothetical protein V1789_05655 [PVC group bacterium]